MLADLNLSFARDKYICLMKQMALEDIDKETSKYIDFDDLYHNGPFTSSINTFYNRYQAYIRKIPDKTARKGHLDIQVKDNDKQLLLKVLYLSFKNKTNYKSLLNVIKNSLRKSGDATLILDLYRRYDYFLGSDYNYTKGLRQLLEIIRTYGICESTEREYNKLIKILSDTVLLKEDKYYYVRILYDFIRKDLDNIEKSSFSNVSFIKEDSEKRVKVKTRTRREDYHGMGDCFLRGDQDREYIGE